MMRGVYTGLSDAALRRGDLGAAWLWLMRAAHGWWAIERRGTHVRTIVRGLRR